MISSETAKRITATARRGYWLKGMERTAKSNARTTKIMNGVSMTPESNVRGVRVSESG